MRWRTPKRAKADKLATVARVEFASEHTFCWFCGSTWNLCVDEMVSGMSFRVVGVQHRLCWTRACGVCNCGPLAGSSPDVLKHKLAMKWIYDRPHFDLAKVNVLRGRAPGAIAMWEVAPVICRILDGGWRRW